MNLKHFIVSASLVICAILGTQAQQPYGGCWHPNDIENWSPESDPTAKFNRARVPLAKRFKEPQLMQANPNQFYEGEICNATILFNMCSLSPSQGANNFIGYQPTYWQYMDKLVYWAGSASEGIIIPPPAGSIDAAHQAGVKILGQIFFPPKEFGGEVGWVKELSKKENGHYPYAKKLYEIAKYFGFDGWFINQETSGAGVKSSTWAEFIKEFNSYADENGDNQMEIMWYDAMTVIDAQILKSHKNTSQFLEYFSEGDHRSLASDINCTEAETFSKIYAGVQTVRSGLTGYNSSLNAAFPTNGHVGSLALFCPEERSWKDNVKNLLGTTDDNGEKAYDAIAKTFANEEQAWVNNDGDPSTGGSSAWRGISGAILERSAITSIPFVSNMCVGVGKHRFVNGVINGTQDWYHSGVQSVLPTWRWWIENRGNLKVSIDWDDAFNHGSCFKIAGTLSGERLMRLYKTNILITDGILKGVYKTTGTTPDLKLSTNSSINPDVTLTAKTTNNINGWTVAEYDLSSLKGKSIYMIGLALKGNGNFEFKLGQISILPNEYTPASTKINNLAVEHRLGETGGDIRATWDFEWSDDFDHFDIYLSSQTGGRTLVGQTRDEAFYIPDVIRNGNEASVSIEIVPVMKDMIQQSPAIAVAEFPKAGAPKVTLKLSRSCVKVGAEVHISAVGTGNPTSWKWTLPESLQLIDGTISSSEITVKTLAEGIQSIGIEATNSLGTSNTSFDAIHVLSETDYNDLTNIALHKKIVGYSGCTNSEEVPENLIDGITNPSSTSKKWCNVSPDNWVIIDCESIFDVYGFKIFDCKSGPENDENIRDYTIELSLDGKTWITVVDEKDKSSLNIKEDWIVPTRARYIRFSPSVSGVLRVWEFEAYGIDAVNMKIQIDPAELKLVAGESGNIVVNYNLNGDIREDNFNCIVNCDDNLEIGDIVEDEQNCCFTIPVTAGKLMGQYDLEISVLNGSANKDRQVVVTVDDMDRPNVLGGMTAILRQYANDYPSDEYVEYTTNLLTDENTTAEALEVIETPSTHTDDFMVIFKAPEFWYLSKVKIYIPSLNRGLNDNDKEGNVNKNISIAIGNSLDDLTRITTFNNIGDVDKLEYILPYHKKTKYIAIICDLNAYYYPSLAEIEAFEQVEDVIPVNQTAEMDGWNTDIIAENLPGSSYVNSFVDDDDSWNLYTTDVAEEGAIASNDRMIYAESGNKYKIAPFNTNNALTLKERNETQTLTFIEPARCEQIQMLVFTGGDYSSRFEVVAEYADGTESESKVYSIKGWDTEGSDVCSHTFGTIYTGKPYGKYTADKIDNSKHYLYEKTLDTDPTKKLVGLKFKSTKSYYPNIIAISRSAFKEAESGVDNITFDKNKEIVAIYNIYGVQVKNPTSGLYIVRYSDGSTKKVLLK